jgi:hypothetical protein
LSGNNSFSGTVDVTTGTLILSGSNSTTATATIASGATLQIGGAGATGSLASTSIVDNGTLIYDTTTDATITAAISGSGGLGKRNSNTVTLNTAATYQGGTPQPQRQPSPTQPLCRSAMVGLRGPCLPHRLSITAL